jgi:lysophospholipase L1-like esterase
MATHAAAARHETILLLGDSITEQGWGVKGGVGWVGLLANAYGRRADVLNRGFGGYTTRTLAPAAARILGVPGAAFALTVVFLGSNDANSAAAQNVPLPEFAARLRALLDAAAAVSRAVLCVAPGPVDDRLWPTRSCAAAAAYGRAAAGAAAAAAAAAAPRGVPVAFASLLEAATGSLDAPAEASATAPGAPPPAWVELLSDGLHLSSAGNAALFRLVLDALKRDAPRALPAALPLGFPSWAAVPAGPGDEAAAAFTDAALDALRGAQ